MKALPLALILSLSCIASAATRAGTIYSGVDTLRMDAYDGWSDYGFDFWRSECCTTGNYTNDICCPHLQFFYNGAEPPPYEYCLGGFLAVASGTFRGHRLGRVNLDSVSQAPPDSIGKRIVVDSITADSLLSRRGETYALLSAHPGAGSFRISST